MEEIDKMIQDIYFKKGYKWSYDPHKIISRRKVKNSYSPYIHESRPEIEKLANGGQFEAQKGMKVETPHLTEKGFKKEIEEVIDLDE